VAKRKDECKVKATNETVTWRWALAVAAVALCYGALHFSCCPEALDGWASLQTLYEFRAPVPFGKRILTAWMAHGLAWTGLSMRHAFEAIEILGAAALAEALRRTFRPWLGEAWSRVAGLLFFGILPAAFLLRSPMTLFLPWDTWAMAFTAWGIHFLLEGRWAWVAGTMTLASFNRESAVLLPMLCAAIHAGRRPWWRFVSATAGLLGIYVLCQWLVGLTLADNGRVFRQLFLGMSWVGEEWVGEPYRLLHNWAWLHAKWTSAFCVAGAMGGLPLWFLGVAGRLPGYFRRFGLVALAYVAMLAVVGNLNEMRIYGETMVILFVPTVLGICDALGEKDLFASSRLDGRDGGGTKWLAWLEMACAVGIVVGLVAIGWCLSTGKGPLPAAVRMEGKSGAWWYQLGTARWSQGERPGAREAWERAVQTDAGHWPAMNNLAWMALEEGRVAEAREWIDRALEFKAARENASVRDTEAAVARAERLAEGKTQ
jgi:hypothetical protein